MEGKGNKLATLAAISALAALICLLLTITPTQIMLAATTPQQQQPQPLQTISGQTTLTGQLTAWSPITVQGQSTITGNLQITNTSSNANLTISPTLTMTNATPGQFTMDTYTTEFHQGYPLGSGGQITINGTTTSPANFTAQGNISIGAVTNAQGQVIEDCLNQNLKQYYTRFTTGPGGSGYIGDWNNATNATKIDVRAPIKVNSGSIQTYTCLQRIVEAHLFITITNTSITFYLRTVPDSDNATYNYYPTYPYVNLSQMAHDRVLPTLRIIIPIDMNDEILNMEQYENCYSSLYYIRWGGNTDFESWSVSDPQNPQPTSINPMLVTDGLINATNTRMVMLTWDSAVMGFTADSTTSSAIKVTPSANYPGNSLRVSLKASSFSSGGWTTGGSVWMVGLQNLTQTNVRLTSYLQDLTSGLRLNLDGSQWFPASTNVTIAGGLTLSGTLNLQRTYGSNMLNLTLSGYVSMPTSYSYISPNNITMTGTATMSGATLTLNMSGNANVAVGSMTMSTSGSASLSLTTTGTLGLNMSSIIGNLISVSLRPPMTGSISSGNLFLTASGTTSIQNLNLTLTSPKTKLNATGSLSLTGDLSLTMSTDGSELSITSTGISVSSAQDNPLTVDIQGSATVSPGTSISLETSTPSATVTDGTMTLTSTNTAIAANITSSGGGTISSMDAYIRLTPSEAYIEISQLQATLGASTINLTLSTDEASVSGLSSLHLETPSVTVDVSNAQLNLAGSTASISLASQQQTAISMGSGQISITAGAGTLNAQLQGAMEMQGNIQLSGNAEINMPDSGKITLNGQLSLDGTLSGNLQLSANMNIATDKTTITLGEGSSTLTMNGNLALTGDLTMGGGTINIITPSSTITITGTLQLADANIQATATSVNLNLQTTTQATNITISSGSTLSASLSGSISVSGDVSMGGATVISLPSGSISLTGTLRLTGASITGSLSLQGVSLTVLDDGTIIGLGSGSSLQADMSGSLAMSGSLSLSGATAISMPSGSLNLTGTLQLTGASMSGFIDMQDVSLVVSGTETRITLGAGSSLRANMSGSLALAGSLEMSGRTVVTLPSGSIIVNGGLALSGARINALASLSGISLTVSNVDTGIGLGSGSVNVSMMSGDLTMSGSVEVSGVLKLGTSGGGLSLDGSMVISNASVAGSLSLTEASLKLSPSEVSINVGGGSLSLNMSGSTTISGSLSLSGSNVISGSLRSSGDSDINGVSRLSGVMDARGSVIIDGLSTISGSMSMGAGSLTLNSSGLFMSGDVVISGSLKVSGSVTIRGNVTMEGSVTMAGTSTISGSISLSGRVNTNSLMLGDIALRADSMTTVGTTSINGKVSVVDGVLKITKAGTEIACSVSISGSVLTYGTLTVKNPEITGNTMILSPITTVGRTSVRGLLQFLMGNLPPAGLTASPMDIIGQIQMSQSLILGSTTVNGLLVVTDKGVTISGSSEISGTLLAINAPSIGQNAILSISQGAAVTPAASIPIPSATLALTTPILSLIALIGLVVARLVVPPIAIASGRATSKVYRRALGVYMRAFGPETRAHVAYIRAKNRLTRVGERAARRTASLLRKPLAKGYMLASQNRVARRVNLAATSIKERASRRIRPATEKMQAARMLASKAAGRMSAAAGRAASTARTVVAKVATIEILLSRQAESVKKSMSVRARALRDRARKALRIAAQREPTRRRFPRVRFKRSR